MTNDELMIAALESSFAATTAIENAYDAGRVAPVPVETFAGIRTLLTKAGCAVQELENRAKGMTEPKRG